MSSTAECAEVFLFLVVVLGVSAFVVGAGADKPSVFVGGAGVALEVGIIADCAAVTACGLVVLALVVFVGGGDIAAAPALTAPAPGPTLCCSKLFPLTGIVSAEGMVKSCLLPRFRSGVLALFSSLSLSLSLPSLSLPRSQEIGPPFFSRSESEKTGSVLVVCGPMGGLPKPADDPAKEGSVAAGVTG